MKKTFFTMAVALFIGLSTSAQIRVGAGLMSGAPAGNFGDTNSIGIGRGVSGEYFFSDHFSLGLAIGYTNFSGKDKSGITNPAISIAPFLITADYHFMPGERFDIYAGIGAGYGFGSLRPDQGDDLNGNAILPSAAVGINLMIFDAIGLDANVGYHLFRPTFDGADESTNLNYVPLNIGLFLVIE